MLATYDKNGIASAAIIAYSTVIPPIAHVEMQKELDDKAPSAGTPEWQREILVRSEQLKKNHSLDELITMRQKMDRAKGPEFSESRTQFQGLVERLPPEKEESTPRWKMPFATPGNTARTLLTMGQVGAVTCLITAGLMSVDITRSAIPAALLAISVPSIFAQPDDKTKKPEGETAIARMRDGLNHPDELNSFYQTAARLPFLAINAAANITRAALNPLVEWPRAVTGFAGISNIAAQIGYFKPPERKPNEESPPEFLKPKIEAVGVVERDHLTWKDYLYSKDAKATAFQVTTVAIPFGVEAANHFNTGNSNMGWWLAVAASIASITYIGDCAYRISKMTAQAKGAENGKLAK